MPHIQNGGLKRIWISNAGCETPNYVNIFLKFEYSLKISESDFDNSYSFVT